MHFRYAKAMIAFGHSLCFSATYDSEQQTAFDCMLHCVTIFYVDSPHGFAIGVLSDGLAREDAIYIEEDGSNL